MKTNAPTGTDRTTVEIWFDFGSPYSYLSAMRIEDVAAACDVRVRWKAMLLGPVFRALGWEGTPMLANESKANYMWRDMERQARRHQLPWKRPSVFPRTAVLPSRVVILGEDEPWVGAFVRGVMQTNFADDAEIDDEGAVRRVLSRLDLPSASIIRDAQSPEIKRRLREQTDLAVHRGVFGAPTFFANGEMFWGDDRLEDAIRQALAKPVREKPIG